MHRILTLNGISNTIFETLTPDLYEVGSDVNAPEAIIVRSTDCRKRELNKELLAIARAGAGVNNIPIPECTDAGIAVFNTPGANANAVNELVLCCMLMASRNVMDGIHWANQLQGNDIMMQVEQGKRQFSGHELQGKTLAVIGLGAIGVMVANHARSLGMHVVGYDPFISVEHAWGLSRAIRRGESLESILPQSDFITMHVPLMEQTKHYINERVLKFVKPGAMVLNLARGELVDNDAILRAVESGHVSKYITDFPAECLLNKKNVICVPHLGASTPESEENCARMAAKELDEYLRLGNISNSVNMPQCALLPAGVYRICALHQNIRNMVNNITGALIDCNIANMINRSRGEYAYTIIDLDHAPESSTVDALKKLHGIIRLRGIDLTEAVR